jgi:hypothetical protein
MSDHTLIPREHRSVENTEDFKEWDWGDPPDQLGKPSEKLESDIVAQIKEWASDIASEAHEKSCAIGAATAYEELVENGFFALEGITDKGLLFVFQGTDDFRILDELAIVDNALDFEDPQEFSAHLRRLADAIDAASPIAPAPPATT